MKYLVLLGLMISNLTYADFVYMQEDKESKSVYWQTNVIAFPAALNDRSSKDWALYPDISPDAKEFLYVEGPDQSNLHLTYSNPSKKIFQRFHLKEKGMLLHPKFTRNTKLIFYSAPSITGKNTIYFFDREAEVQQQGTHLADFNLSNSKPIDPSEESYFPKPSADGSFVVYQRNSGGKKEIILFDRIENKKTILAEGMSPALSFDEQWIAFTAKKDGNWNIYLLNRMTKEIKEATDDPKDEMAPTFMPDNTLVFASNKSGNYRLYKQVGEKWVSLLKNEAALKGKDFYSPQFSGEPGIAQKLKAPFIGAPRSSFGTVVHEGKVYMAGGHQGAEHTYPPESFTDTFIVYDQETNEWKDLAQRPFKAHGYQLAAYGNYIYAFGGFAYSAEHKPKWKSLDVIDRYSIKENKWETIGKLNTPRSSNVAVTINDKVYIAAGWNSTPKFENDLDGKFLDTIEIFDLKKETLEVADFKIPSPVRRALTGIEYKGKIVLIGGLGEGASHFELLNKVTSIDPRNGEAKELTPLPFATFAPAAETIGNELFVFGGMFKLSEMNYEYVAHIYGLDIANSKWSHTGRFLRETKGFSQVFKLNNSTLGILGGHHYFEGYDSPVSTFETFSKR